MATSGFRRSLQRKETHEQTERSARQDVAHQLNLQTWAMCTCLAWTGTNIERVGCAALGQFFLSRRFE